MEIRDWGWFIHALEDSGDFHVGGERRAAL